MSAVVEHQHAEHLSEKGADKPSCLIYKGTLKGHGDMVTSISTAAGESCDTLLSSSRDKKLILWKMDESMMGYGEIGVAKKSLEGHGQAVTDCSLSAAMKGAKFCVSASMDKTLRLWDIEKGNVIKTFQGHTSDVNSCAFSADSRQVVSGSRDKSIKVWNTRGECKFTSSLQDSHSDWVSCVRFSPSPNKTPALVSCGWDRTVRSWCLTKWTCKKVFVGHEGSVHTITVSPDGSLCASGGKDKSFILWDLGTDKSVYTIDTKQAYSGSVNDLCFHPRNYWLCAAMDRSIRIWELQYKYQLADIILKWDNEGQDNTQVGLYESTGSLLDYINSVNNLSRSLPWATCLQWDRQGNMLYVGTSNGDIHVFTYVDSWKHGNVESQA